MLPKGVVDADGFQRFSYPSGDLTGKAKAQTRKSITIPLLIPERKGRATERKKPQPIKFLQKFACKSETWKRWFGVRSLVESSNNLLKLASAEDIGNSKKRSGRGFAFNYIAATLAAVSSNIRRIITFFEEETKRSTPTRIRYRRRKTNTARRSTAEQKPASPRQPRSHKRSSSFSSPAVTKTSACPKAG